MDALRKSVKRGWQPQIVKALNLKKTLRPPMDQPRGWVNFVNRPQTAEEEAAVRLHIERNRLYGQAQWAQRTARRLGLEQSLRPRGRPVGWRKATDSEEEGDKGSRHSSRHL